MQNPAELFSLIEARRSELGLSQAELGLRAFGRADASPMKNLKRGSSPSVERLAALAEAIGYELYFGPMRNTHDAPVASANESARFADQFAAVPRFEAELSAGPGVSNQDEAPISAVAFRRDWLAREGISPSAAMVLPVKGDSMAPTLCDGDLVMIDRRKVTPVGRRIYALIGPDGEARVKRIERLPKALLLHSDNDTVPTELIAPSDADRIRILGQVVWWGHTMRD